MGDTRFPPTSSKDQLYNPPAEQVMRGTHRVASWGFDPCHVTLAAPCF